MVLVLIRPRLALVAYAYDTILLQRDRGATAVMDPGKAALGAAERLFELRGFPIVDEEHLSPFVRSMTGGPAQASKACFVMPSIAR